VLSHVVMPCIRLCEQNAGEGCVWFKCRYGPRESDRRDAFSEEGRLQCDVKFATFARHTRKISFSQVQQPTPPLTDQHKSRSCKTHNPAVLPLKHLIYFQRVLCMTPCFSTSRPEQAPDE